MTQSAGSNVCMNAFSPPWQLFVHSFTYVRFSSAVPGMLNSHSDPVSCVRMSLVGGRNCVSEIRSTSTSGIVVAPSIRIGSTT